MKTEQVNTDKPQDEVPAKPGDKKCLHNGCRFNRFVSIITINIVLLLILLCLIEMFLRRADPVKTNTWKVEPTFSYYEMFTLRPFTSTYLNVETVPGVTTLRITPSNPANGIKVYMFGGSTMAGERNPEDAANSDLDTVPSHLALISVSNKYPMVVDNYGVPCYRSNEELMKLIKLLRAGYRPDVVVFYHGFNDTEFALNGQVCYDILKPVETAFEKDAIRNTVSTLLDKIAIYQHCNKAPCLQSNILNVLSMPFDRGGNSAAYIRIDQISLKSVEEEKAYCVRTYVENARMAEALGKDYGFKPVFVLQPMTYFKKHRSEQEQKVYDALPEKMKKGVPEFYAAIADGMRWSGNFIFAADMFDGHSETIYPFDQGHTFSYGNRIIAEYLFNVITNKVGVRKDY